jgi:N-dimethylarginine dimethylaminohydrolase
MNSTVLMSSAKYFSNELQINPYYADESVDIEAAMREHDHLRATLEHAGIAVRQVAAPPDSQDGVYTANWALIRGNKAVLARLPEARKSEEDWAERQLRAFDLDVMRVPEDWHFSGQGDALPCGSYLFCGQGYRSDARAQAFAAEELDYKRIQLQTVPLLDQAGNPVINQESGWADSFYYDIDLAMSISRAPGDGAKGIIAYCPQAFTPESVDTLQALSQEFDFIIVSEKEAIEAFACNLVSTGETVIMSANAPSLQEDLEIRGMKTLTPEVIELAKGGGFIRCQTLSFNE